MNQYNALDNESFATDEKQQRETEESFNSPNSQKQIYFCLYQLNKNNHGLLQLAIVWSHFTIFETLKMDI